MRSSILTGLPGRAGFSIAAIALVLVAIISSVLYQQIYNQEMQRTSHSRDQLVATVGTSAAIASYLDNVEIAQEVVVGLAKNDTISGAAISSDTGMYLSSGNMEQLDVEEPFYNYPLYSPFLETQQVGAITIQPNRLLIEERAKKTARVQVFIMALQTLAIIAFVILFVYWQLTRPIRFVAHQLHRIKPGERRRLKKPRGHKKDEIGELVVDANQLLETVSNAFEKERELRTKVESLERQFRLIFESASGGIALSSSRGNLLLHNPSFEKIIGKERVEPFINSENKLLPEIFENPEEVGDVFKQVSTSLSTIAMDLKLVGDEGTEGTRWLHCLFSPVENENGELLVESIVYDISERAMREKLTRIEAEQDALTLLLNRRAGERLLARQLEECYARDRKCALLMIDLDNFKPINDNFGHEAGDKVLIEVARRLKNATRSNDLVSRWGGDEFLVVAVEGSGAFEASPIAERILKLLAEGIDLGDGKEGVVGASIGIALYPEHAKHKNVLISLADSAMYRVKQSGRNGYAFAEEKDLPSESGDML